MRLGRDSDDARKTEFVIGFFLCWVAGQGIRTMPELKGLVPVYFLMLLCRAGHGFGSPAQPPNKSKKYSTSKPRFSGIVRMHCAATCAPTQHSKTKGLGHPGPRTLQVIQVPLQGCGLELLLIPSNGVCAQHSNDVAVLSHLQLILPLHGMRLPPNRLRECR